MWAHLHQMLARFGGFLRSSDDGELDEELRAHLAMAEEEKVRQGMSRVRARREARIELGGVTQLREAVRDARGLPQLDSFWLDIKLGLRMLRKSWGLTVIGGLAITLTISIAVAVYTAFAWAAGSTLPLEDGERVVVIESLAGESLRPAEIPLADLARWRASVQSLIEISAFRNVERNVMFGDPGGRSGGGGLPEVVAVAEISASGLRLARVAPVAGRLLADEDEHPGAAPVVVIGYDVWQSRFSGDPAVVGRTVRFGGTPHTVVGVMPEDFAFPINHRFWTPLRLGASDRIPAAPEGGIFGRLARGATRAGAHAELTTVGQLPAADQRADTLAPELRVAPYISALSGDGDGREIRWIMRLALIVVTLLLVPPCANIAILVYARTITRQEEFAARYALGANRSRIVGQLFIEMLVLSLVAAAVALLVVRLAIAWAVGVLLTHPSGALPFWIDLDLPAGAVAFAGILAVVAALVAGLLPALKATGRSMRSGLGGLGRRTGARLGATWTALVVLQVALTVAALPTAVEIGWGTVRKGVIGPGFAAEEYLTARVAIGQPSSTSTAARVGPDFANLEAELMRRLRAEPGVVGAAVGALPGDEPWRFMELDRASLPAEVVLPPRSLVRIGEVGEGFLDLFDIGFLLGRGFDDSDFVVDARAVVVNRTFVEKHLGEANPLGVRLRPAMDDDESPPGADRSWSTIVGVVEDRPAGATRGTVYRPRVPGQVQPAILALRAQGDPAVLSERLRDVAAALDPTLLVTETRTLQAIYTEKRRGNDMGALTLGAVMLSMLLLSAAGIHALMSFTVNQRRREIGVRAALGAQPQRLLAGIFGHAARQLVLGAGCGVLFSLLVDHYLPAEQLGGWQVPFVVPVATVAMVLVGLLAVAGPARRGLQVDPIEELRQG